MKNITRFLLSLAIVFQSISFSTVQAGELSCEEAKWKARVDQVIADIDKVEDISLVVKDEKIQKVYAVSEKTMGMVLAVVDEAFKLVADVKEGTQNEEIKKNVAADMTDALRQLFFLFMRHHGLDKLEVDGRPTAAQNVKQMFTEMISDVGIFFSMPKDAFDQRQWGPKEAHRREILARGIIEKFQNFATQQMADVDANSEFYKFAIENLQSVVNRGIDIRAQRDTAQRMARNTYLGAGVFLFLFPIVDLTGERTYLSTWHSSLIYLSTFLTATSIKSMTNSSEVFRRLKILEKVLKDPKQVDKMIAEGQAEMGFWHRVGAHFERVKDSCIGLLGGKKEAKK